KKSPLTSKLILGVIMAISLSGMTSFADKNISIHQAITKQNVTLVIDIIKQNPNSLELKDRHGRTPLMLATQSNNVKVAEILIEAGANVNAKDRIQDTPYLLAGAEGYNEILKLTLANGANIKDTNRYGGTAIIPAAEKGHLE